MTRQTRLVALSLVSNVNGFQHDLRKVCEIAHAHGALVYADIVQAAGAGVAQLDYSLDYIHRLGVAAIQRHRQPLLDRARRELERAHYRCMTPEHSESPILTFICRDAMRLSARLDAARVSIAVGDNRFRISPSVFNDMQDIDRLLEALT